jgi:hypothetical protein
VTSDATLVVDNVRVKIAGPSARVDRFDAAARPFRIGGSSAKLTIDMDRIYFDVNVTNLTVSGGSFYGIDLGEPTGSVMAGRISRLVVQALNITPLGIIIVRDTTTLTISPAITVEDCDFTGMTGGNDEIWFVNAATRSKFILRKNNWRSTSTNLGTLEQLDLDGLALNSEDGTYFLTAVAFPPPEERAEWATSVDSDGGVLVRDPLYENRTITATVEVWAGRATRRTP